MGNVSFLVNKEEGGIGKKGKNRKSGGQMFGLFSLRRRREGERGEEEGEKEVNEERRKEECKRW